MVHLCYIVHICYLGHSSYQLAHSACYIMHSSYYIGSFHIAQCTDITYYKHIIQTYSSIGMVYKSAPYKTIHGSYVSSSFFIPLLELSIITSKQKQGEFFGWCCVNLAIKEFCYKNLC